MGFTMNNAVARLLLLAINPISMVLWRKLKEKMRRRRLFFRAEKGGGEDEVFK